MLADYLPSISGLIGEQDINSWHHNKYEKRDTSNLVERMRRSVGDETPEKDISVDETEKTLMVNPGKRLAKMLRSFADMAETFEG